MSAQSSQVVQARRKAADTAPLPLGNGRRYERRGMSTIAAAWSVVNAGSPSVVPSQAREPNQLPEKLSFWLTTGCLTDATLGSTSSQDD
jgi:hypothetical protein